MSRLQSFSMTGEISPVHAPSFAQCMFCAPTLTEVSASRAFTSRTAVKGGMTKRWMRASRPPSAAFRPSAKSFASASVLFIFQLVPTQNVRLMTSSPLRS
jgi:hypothetical protein